MQLQSQHAVQQSLGVTIYKVEYQATIHVMLNVITFGLDDDIIPFVQFEQLFIFFSLIEFVLRYFPFPIYLIFLSECFDYTCLFILSDLPQYEQCLH